MTSTFPEVHPGDVVRSALVNSLSQSVQQLTDRVAALEPPKGPAPLLALTLTPTLVATGTPWDHVFGGATKHAGATDASGMMAIQLPQGATIQTFGVTGQKGSGNLGINLRRQSLDLGSSPEFIVGLTPGAGPFSLSAGAPANQTAKVDNTRFRYYITAELDSATAAATVLLSSFQVFYIGS